MKGVWMPDKYVRRTAFGVSTLSITPEMYKEFALHFGKKMSSTGTASQATVTPTDQKKEGKSKMSNTATAKKEDEKDIPKVDFEYAGSKIVIPEGMDLDDAIGAMERQRDEENVTVSISEQIDAFPMDGAVAMMHVLKKRYGWTNLVPTKGFFGDYPPVMVGVEVGPNERIQVPWGNCKVPKIDGQITTGFAFKDGMPVFRVSGNVKRKDERTLSALAREMREHIKAHSIYRGKAIKINFRNSDDERREFDTSLCPKFIDLEATAKEEPIFSTAIERDIKLNVYNPIIHAQRCRNRRLSLKRGVLLGGPYGTGKTLTAYKLARLCVEHGWTFLYLEDVRDLDLAIGFAKLYQPCVLFAEDVDRATTGPRDPQLDKILNTLDGIESKEEGSAVQVVLTTNHLDWINRAFLRPGRIDKVINVLPPDADACGRIVKKYGAEGGCSVVGSDEDIRQSIKSMVGANAAFIKAVVDQAKLSAIENDENPEGPLVITPKDLQVASDNMLPHVKLINPEHGKKSLLDLEDEGQAMDPMQMAMDIFVQKMSEGFLHQLTNPKILSKVLIKQAKKGGLGGPSMN